MNWEAITAVGGAVGSVIALGGVVGQHIWFRGQLKHQTDLTHYSSLVDNPVSNSIHALDDFEGLVHDFSNGRLAFTVDDVNSKGVRVARTVNSAINRASKFDRERQDDWYAIDTDKFLQALDDLSEEAIRQFCTALNYEIKEIRKGLEDCMELVRPC